MAEKKIVTNRVGRDFAESNAVLLEETEDTLLYFRAGIHSGGVRGFLTRVKKTRSGTWTGTNIDSFEKVPLAAGTRAEIELSTEVVNKLCEAIEERRQIVEQGIKRGKQEYIVAEKERVVLVDDQTKKGIFEQLLSRGYSADFWKLLEESQPELATRLSVGHLYAEKRKALVEFAERLKGDFPETAGPDSWQSWIYKNKWLFGVNYTNTIEKMKISIGGIMPDFLFLTADNFVDVLEIKLPKEEVVIADASHPGAYRWSGKTNEAIGQAVSYIDSIERFQDALEKEILRVYGVKASCVKPRAFILIGSKVGWDEYKRSGLRRLNSSLHGIEVLTYSDLIQRGKEIAEMYKQEAVSQEGNV
jgi:hypothetical protein